MMSAQPVPPDDVQINPVRANSAQAFDDPNKATMIMPRLNKMGVSPKPQIRMNTEGQETSITYDIDK